VGNDRLGLWDAIRVTAAIALVYESDGKRWRPKAVVSVYHGGALHQKLVSAPIDVLFDSEVEVDTYSLAMAKKWIDDKG
jgi:hypothetical protein